jgi:hypothetical protein
MALFIVTAVKTSNLTYPSWFSMVFLGPTSNSEFVPKFNVAMNASNPVHPFSLSLPMPN